MALRVPSGLLVPVTVWSCLAPALVHAAPANGAAPASDAAPATDELAPEPDPDQVAVAEAQQLFGAGADKFETADYAGAIELWTRAYGLVPSIPEYSGVKARLIANLAAAQQRAYEVDHEVGHLNQAKILLESYRRAIPDIYPSAEEQTQELTWIDERVADIDAELAAVAAREAAARDADEESLPPPLHPGRGLIIGGGVLAGLGVAGLGLMVGGMVLGGQNNDISDLPSNDLDARGSRFDEGRLGNSLAIAGGITGGVLLGTGVALLVVGLRQKARAGSLAPETSTARATVVPILDRSQVGVGVVGRF